MAGIALRCPLARPSGSDARLAAKPVTVAVEVRTGTIALGILTGKICGVSRRTASVASLEVRPAEPNRETAFSCLQGMGKRVAVLSMVGMAPTAAVRPCSVIFAMFLAVTAIGRGS